MRLKTLTMQQPSSGITNRTWMTAGVWIIATVAIGMVLNQGAKILAPFAMSIFVWLVMEGFARAIRRPFPHIPNWAAHAFAIAVVAISIIAFASILRGAIVEFTDRAGEYESRINSLIEQTYNTLGLSGGPQQAPAPAVAPSPGCVHCSGPAEAAPRPCRGSIRSRCRRLAWFRWPAVNGRPTGGWQKASSIVPSPSRACPVKFTKNSVEVLTCSATAWEAESPIPPAVR